jgi:hypothetical protein
LQLQGGQSYGGHNFITVYRRLVCELDLAEK